MPFREIEGKSIEAEQKEEKFDVSSFEAITEAIPELKIMKGLDQKSDFHDLTLDIHTQEVVKNLERDPLISKLPQKDLILLAGYLHDLGKTSPEGSQVHPKDPEKRQYIGHEKVSEKMVREILSPYNIKFSELSENDLELVAKLVGLHASALNLVNNFETNNQPKGKELGAYDDFVKKVEEIPGYLTTKEKLKVVIGFNRADILATYNENSDLSSERVSKIVDKAKKSTRVLDEIEKALPALVEAIKARRSGKQQAGIVFKDGEYLFQDQAEVQKKEVSAAFDEKSIEFLKKNFTQLGIGEDNKDAFFEILSKEGIPGLGKAGFGKQIGIIKEVFSKLKRP